MKEEEGSQDEKAVHAGTTPTTNHEEEKNTDEGGGGRRPFLSSGPRVILAKHAARSTWPSELFWKAELTGTHKTTGSASTIGPSPRGMVRGSFPFQCPPVVSHRTAVFSSSSSSSATEREGNEWHWQGPVDPLPNLIRNYGKDCLEVGFIPKQLHYGVELPTALRVDLR